jgi:hypothetical protein
MRSPFEDVFIDAPAPPVFEAQFLHAPEDAQPQVLEGEMTRVWLRHTWLRPIMWLLSRFGVLIGKTGEHIPTRLEIIATRNAEGVPHQAYQRTLRFDTTETFNTVMSYLPKHQRAAEFFGPFGAMYMIWKAEFEPPDRLSMSTAHFGFRVFGVLITLPALLSRWMFGNAGFVQKALSEDTTSIDLVISHPVLGDIFGYEGIFKIHRND